MFFGFSDVSNIPNTEILEVKLVEAPDIVKPVLVRATVNYAIGRLSVSFNEFMYYNATLEGPRCDLCSGSGDASSETACTDLTGNAYTDAKCEGGSAAADPYTADADGSVCTTNTGTYTSPSCTNGGDASSQIACEGSSTGNIFSFGGGDASAAERQRL